MRVFPSSCPVSGDKGEVEPAGVRSLPDGVAALAVILPATVFPMRLNRGFPRLVNERLPEAGAVGKAVPVREEGFRRFGLMRKRGIAQGTCPF
jgi:hypothetical protein